MNLRGREGPNLKPSKTVSDAMLSVGEVDPILPPPTQKIKSSKELAKQTSQEIKATLARPLEDYKPEELGEHLKWLETQLKWNGLRGNLKTEIEERIAKINGMSEAVETATPIAEPVVTEPEAVTSTPEPETPATLETESKELKEARAMVRAADSIKANLDGKSLDELARIWGNVYEMGRLYKLLSEEEYDVLKNLSLDIGNRINNLENELTTPETKMEAGGTIWTAEKEAQYQALKKKLGK